MKEDYAQIVHVESQDIHNTSTVNKHKNTHEYILGILCRCSPYLINQITRKTLRHVALMDPSHKFHNALDTCPTQGTIM